MVFTVVGQIFAFAISVSLARFVIVAVRYGQLHPAKKIP